jgi:hypothetical protein
MLGGDTDTEMDSFDFDLETFSFDWGLEQVINDISVCPAWRGHSLSSLNEFDTVSLTYSISSASASNICDVMTGSGWTKHRRSKQWNSSGEGHSWHNVTEPTGDEQTAGDEVIIDWLVAESIDATSACSMWLSMTEALELKLMLPFLEGMNGHVRRVNEASFKYCYIQFQTGKIT